MTSIPIQKLIIFIGFYGVASILSMFSLQSASAGSDFESLIDSSLQAQEVQIGQLEASGDVNALEAPAKIASVTTTGIDTVPLLFKSLTLQAPFWQSEWASYIRLVLWVVAGVIALYIMFEGLRLLSNFIPFT